MNKILALEVFLGFGLVGFGFLTYAAYEGLKSAMGPVGGALLVGSVFVLGAAAIFILNKPKLSARS